MTPTTPLWYSEADACGMYAQEQLAAEIVRTVADASASATDELQSLNEAMWLTENEPSHKRIGLAWKIGDKPIFGSAEWFDELPEVKF